MIISVKDASELTGLRPATIRRAILAGRLPTAGRLSSGGPYLLEREEVLAAYREGRIPGRSGRPKLNDTPIARE